MLLAFHKPYGVLSQFTADGSPIEVTVPASLPVNTESTVHVWSGPGIR